MSNSSKTETPPKYNSPRFHSVILGGKAYKEWVVNYVGSGKMNFSHPTLGNFSASRPVKHGWMQECWNEFLGFVTCNDSQSCIN